MLQLVHHWGLDAKTRSITWVHSPEVHPLGVQTYSNHQGPEVGHGVSQVQGGQGGLSSPRQDFEEGVTLVCLQLHQSEVLTDKLGCQICRPELLTCNVCSLVLTMEGASGTVEPVKSGLDGSWRAELFPLSHIKVSGWYLGGCFSLSSLTSYLLFSTLSYTLFFWVFGVFENVHLKLYLLKYTFPNSYQRVSLLKAAGCIFFPINGTSYFSPWGLVYGGSNQVASHLVQIFRGRYVVMADLGASTEAQCPSMKVQTFNSCTLFSSVTSNQASKFQEVFSHHPTLELLEDVLYNAHLLGLDFDNFAMVFLSRIWMPQLLVHHWGLDASTWSITWVHSPEVHHLVQSAGPQSSPDV